MGEGEAQETESSGRFLRVKQEPKPLMYAFIHAEKIYLTQISKNKVFVSAQCLIVKTQIAKTKFGKLFFPINRYMWARLGTVPGSP